MGDPVELDKECSKEGEVSNKDIINDIHNHEEKNATEKKGKESNPQLLEDSQQLLEGGEDIGSCLTDLGVVHHSHQLLEDKITRKIELRNDLSGVQKELEILLKRKSKKESELDEIYKANLHGRHKRKIQALLSEQEKLNTKLEELRKEEKSLINQLQNGDNIESETTKEKVDCSDLQLCEEKSEEDQIKLGIITSFGSTVESTQGYESGSRLREYLTKMNSTPSASSTPLGSSTPSTSFQLASVKRNKTEVTDTSRQKRMRLKEEDSDSDYDPRNDKENENVSDEDFESKEEENVEEEVDYQTDSDQEEGRKNKKFTKVLDDGDKEIYIQRLKNWERKRDSEEKELDGKFEQLKAGLRVPSILWTRLYNYQKVGVQWMYELHQQKVGGILGDEMGLGKTVQVIAYLASLSYTKSKGSQGATIIVAPTTLLQNWVHEMHTWWPPFRVGMLHASGTYTGSKTSLIRSINYHQGILVMSYQSLITYKELLGELNWGYCILDEGHKIRNPDAQVTLAVKQIATPHRIILSGSPLQNNLKELWSLFDFVYPSKLGTLPTFIQQFSSPITQGGFANATEVQVATAFKCATVLKDTINPFLLRRMKADVKDHINLPEKNEQVLFCKLTNEQRALYRSYVDSPEIKSILDGRMRVFVGLIALRKICNHPDIFIYNNQDEEHGYGHYERSGKMVVVHSLLKIWKKQGHRVLLFTQSRKMLQILEMYAKEMDYSYLKMDGTTSVGNRQPLINRFNETDSIFLFILTTKVGGLGVNLCGADRVVIFDPDWNPSTDTQARERAWRIGQKRPVTIYRLMTSGTIEEKIYHRQIYKQFLINRVLKDPKQRRFFKSRDLFELFTLNETNDDKTETSAIFAGTGTDVRVTPKNGNTNSSKKRKLVDKFHGDTDPAPIKRRESEKFKRSEATKELFYEAPEEGEISEQEDNTDTARSNERKSSKKRKLKKEKRSRSEEKEEERSSEKDRHRKRKKGKKDRAEKGAKFEGERVQMLVKQRRYQAPPPEKGEEQPEDKPDSKHQDNYVLAKLFKKSGVHSAVQHDVIMDNSTADYAVIETEARRAADEAMQALRASRAQCQRAESGIPNWTGQHGQKRKIAIKVGNKPLASSDLLSRMKNRNKIVSSVERSGPAGGGEGENIFFQDDGGAGSRGNQEDIELLTDIRNFIAFQTSTNGEARTTELLSKFQGSLPSQRSPLFKAFLKQICDFRREDDRGVWTLKQEFR